MKRHRIPIVLAALVAACSSGAAHEPRRGEQSSAADNPASTRVVDSIFPLEEALRRFRANLPEVTALEGGAPSRNELVAAFIAALRTRDTAALRMLVVSRAEFAWLYYPTSVFSRDPYYQMPQLTWSLNLVDSEKGIARALERFGGDQLHPSGYRCPDIPRMDGAFRFWDGCQVRVQSRGEVRDLRLFGSIAEYGGRFKFYSYANDL
jgi:hypothetical protein